MDIENLYYTHVNTANVFLMGNGVIDNSTIRRGIHVTHSINKF